MTEILENVTVKIAAKFDFDGIKPQDLHKGMEKALKESSVSGEMIVPVDVRTKYHYHKHEVDEGQLTSGMLKTHKLEPQVVVAPKISYSLPAHAMAKQLEEQQVPSVNYCLCCGVWQL
jgi:hypothetical protein